MQRTWLYYRRSRQGYISAIDVHKGHCLKSMAVFVRTLVRGIIYPVDAHVCYNAGMKIKKKKGACTKG